MHSNANPVPIEEWPRVDNGLTAIKSQESWMMPTPHTASSPFVPAMRGRFFGETITNKAKEVKERFSPGSKQAAQDSHATPSHSASTLPAEPSSSSPMQRVQNHAQEPQPLHHRLLDRLPSYSSLSLRSSRGVRGASTPPPPYLPPRGSRRAKISLEADVNSATMSIGSPTSNSIRVSDFGAARTAGAGAGEVVPSRTTPVGVHSDAAADTNEGGDGDGADDIFGPADGTRERGRQRLGRTLPPLPIFPPLVAPGAEAVAEVEGDGQEVDGGEESERENGEGDGEREMEEWL